MTTHSQPVVHLSGPVLGVPKPANLHAPVALVIFHPSLSLTAARLAAMRTFLATSGDYLRLSASSTVGVLTCGPRGRALVTAEDLAIDDDKEQSWIAVYENERDLLEDTIYRRLQSLWSEFSDAYAVFDEHGPAQLVCAQKVWEALLGALLPSPAQAHANRPSCPRNWTPYDLGRRL